MLGSQVTFPNVCGTKELFISNFFNEIILNKRYNLFNILLKLFLINVSQ